MHMDTEMLEHEGGNDSSCCSADGTPRKSHHSDKVKKQYTKPIESDRGASTRH